MSRFYRSMLFAFVFTASGLAAVLLSLPWLQYKLYMMAGTVVSLLALTLIAYAFQDKSFAHKQHAASLLLALLCTALIFGYSWPFLIKAFPILSKKILPIVLPSIAGIFLISFLVVHHFIKRFAFFQHSLTQTEKQDAGLGDGEKVVTFPATKPKDTTANILKAVKQGIEDGRQPEGQDAAETQTITSENTATLISKIIAGYLFAGADFEASCEELNKCLAKSCGDLKALMAKALITAIQQESIELTRDYSPWTKENWEAQAQLIHALNQWFQKQNNGDIVAQARFNLLPDVLDAGRNRYKTFEIALMEQCLSITPNYWNNCDEAVILTLFSSYYLQQHESSFEGERYKETMIRTWEAVQKEDKKLGKLTLPDRNKAEHVATSYKLRLQRLFEIYSQAAREACDVTPLLEHLSVGKASGSIGSSARKKKAQLLGILSPLAKRVEFPASSTQLETSAASSYTGSQIDEQPQGDACQAKETSSSSGQGFVV